MWDRSVFDYSDIADAQHFVNNGRRQQNMPVVYRSGLYSGNDSTDKLDIWDEFEPSYSQLVKTSPPPWDLPLILEIIEARRQRFTQTFITPSSGHGPSEGSADGENDSEGDDSEGKSDRDEDDGDAGS